MDAFGGLSFAEPQRLWLLVAAPAVAMLLVAAERRRAAAAELFVSTRVRGSSNGLRPLRPWLLVVALTLGVAASAGPRFGDELRELPAIESNLVVALDLSQSMDARDAGTSRLSAAKAIARGLTESSDARVGLIVFESTAETVSPLTEDHAAVATLIDSLETGELAESGSDFAKAIDESIELAKSVGDRAVDVVIISDGEHRGGRWEESLGVARARGLRISAVVVGTSQGAAIPAEDGASLEDASGNVVKTRASEEPLRTIAKECGGRFWANPSEPVTAQLVVAAEAANAGKGRVERIPIERYQWPLGAAFVLFLAGMVVNRGAE
ncbi:MAG: VWA domain-containing protein [Acidobacteria bacterium]|nr:VWA domain-containing protein [Acidobacteriota bacterium]